jgi:hypothetical protein
MNLDVVILRLKGLCPLLNGNVAGAAEYQQGVRDEAWLTPPAAYVIPLDDEAEDNLDLQGLDQFVTERVGVVVMFSNAAGVAAGDRRGQTASELFNPIKWQLYSAMLNWRPNSSAENPGLVLPTDPGANHSAKGFAYVGGHLLDADLSRLFYEWDFGLRVQLSDADGSWPPLTANLEDLWIGVIKLFRTGRSFVGQPLEQLLAAADISLPPDDRSL